MNLYTSFILCYQNQPSNIIKKMIDTFTPEELNISKKDKYGNTAFMYCCDRQDKEVVMNLMLSYKSTRGSSFKNDKQI